MNNNKRRISIRLPNYDYSQAGAYFITICTWWRQCILGEIIDDRMILSESGQIVSEEWFRSADIRQEIYLDTFIVMPNHIHGIVIIKDKDKNDQRNISLYKKGTVGATGGSPICNQPGTKIPKRATGQSPLPPQITRVKPPDHHPKNPKGPRPKSLGSFITGFKSSVTIRFNRLLNTPGRQFWQRNYYEHVIRNEMALHKYRKYILENPLRWAMDKNNPENL